MVFEYISIGLGALSVVLYFVGRHQGKKDTEKLKKEIRDEVSDDSVKIANAQLRVKNGGKVAKREGKIIGAHERSVNQTVNISENVVAVKKSGSSINENVPVTDSVEAKITKAKDRKFVAKNEVSHSTDTFVAENKKTFTIDAILTEEEVDKRNSESSKNGSKKKSELKK